MNFKKINIKGETILETLIALGILSIGIIMATTVIGYSLRNMNASKNRILAINIAREGIESMRNIRDTNWLKYSSNRRSCWNHNPSAGICDGNNSILPGDYIIYKESVNHSWKLEEIPRTPAYDEAPDLGTTGTFYYNTPQEITYISNGIEWVDFATLSIVDIDTLVDTDLDHDYTNDTDIYNHLLTSDGDTYGTQVKDTLFKRYLTVEYIANEGGLITNPALLGAEHNRMRITATVYWREGKYEFETYLSTNLTDYLGRERLDG